MRVRTWSACVVLAWGILLILMAVGPSGSFRPAQANTRIASSTSNTSTKTTITTQATLTSSVTSAPARRVGTYVVQPGDTLSGIAAALGVRAAGRAVRGQPSPPSARIRASSAPGPS